MCKVVCVMWLWVIMECYSKIKISLDYPPESLYPPTNWIGDLCITDFISCCQSSECAAKQDIRKKKKKETKQLFSLLTKLSFLYILESATFLEQYCKIKLKKINQNNKWESLSPVPPTQNIKLRFFSSKNHRIN